MASGTIEQVREPHPASAEVFDGDRGNEGKLLRRAITRQDVETVHASRPRYVATSDRAATWLMVGRDRGGRELVIGVVWVDAERRVLRAVAGWPA